MKGGKKNIAELVRRSIRWAGKEETQYTFGCRIFAVAAAATATAVIDDAGTRAYALYTRTLAHLLERVPRLMVLVPMATYIDCKRTRRKFNHTHTPAVRNQQKYPAENMAKYTVLLHKMLNLILYYASKRATGFFFFCSFVRSSHVLCGILSLSHSRSVITASVDSLERMPCFFFIQLCVLFHPDNEKWSECLKCVSECIICENLCSLWTLETLPRGNKNTVTRTTT